MSVKKLFLSVGAMKAGTTFLFNTISRHPDIFVTPEKELHYFAHTQPMSESLQRPLVPHEEIESHRIEPGAALTHAFRRHRLSSVLRNRFARVNVHRLRVLMRWYADCYLRDPIDETWFDRAFEEAGDRWCSEFSNYNALLNDEGWAGVRSHCEQLRVMYVMRDPVERLWSHMKFEMLPAGKREALIKGDLEQLNLFLATASSAHARYTEIVASLQRNLAPEERFIVKLEDIVADLPGQMGRLSDFLGVDRMDFDSIDPSKRANETERLEIPKKALALIRETLADEIRFYEQASAFADAEA